MNLVDAIRIAGEARAGSSVAAQAIADTTDRLRKIADGQEPKAVMPLPKPVPAPEPISLEGEANSIPVTVDGQVVRIELQLTPEQIHGFLKEALGSQRSIMTAREVAQLLRTTTHNIERLAQEGSLPGFQLDGAWRFQKSEIDAWMHARPDQAA